MTENQRRIILESHDLKYSEGVPTITDSDYDKMKGQFRQEYPTNPYNGFVGVPVSDDSKVKLPFTLGSLNKVKDDGSYDKWVEDNQDEYVYWAKLDGVSGLVQYVDGKYHRAMTRGDGEYGQDITEKLRMAVPEELESPVSGFYRCEIMLVGNTHITLGYKTRRNGAAGILNRDGIKQCEHLVVYFYELVDEDSYIPKTVTEISRAMYMRGLGLSMAPHFWSGKSLSCEEIVEFLTSWKTANDYDIDGVVVVVNNSEREDTYYPELKCAFKVNEEAVLCDVVGITWQVGRTGRVVPVVNIKPTEIGGVTVSNATGFNYEYVLDNGVGVGAKVGIYRSGDVIPYIDFVQDGVDMSGELLCPSCYEPTTRKGVDMVCPSLFCEDRDALQVEHFLTTLGCENVTAVTLKKLEVSNIYEAYQLDDLEISQLDGFGIKRAQQIIAEINKTLKTTPAKLLASFGMTGIGNTVSQNILKVYDFDDIWGLDEEMLLKVDGVGDILASNFVSERLPFKSVYSYMKEEGLKWSTASNNLKGMVFCLTGNGTVKRDDLVKMIESNGGYVKGMSKKVDYLVTSDPNSQSGKAKKAREYGKQVISYEALMELL